MQDEMFLSDDLKSLRRGKRRARRTETCRPCLMWPASSPDAELQGVVMDLSPYGMLVRTLGALPAGMEVKVQLMRDEDFRDPLAAPVEGMVVRSVPGGEGFTDHGVQVVQRDIRRPECSHSDTTVRDRTLARAIAPDR